MFVTVKNKAAATFPKRIENEVSCWQNICLGSVRRMLNWMVMQHCKSDGSGGLLPRQKALQGWQR